MYSLGKAVCNGVARLIWFRTRTESSVGCSHDMQGTPLDDATGAGSVEAAVLLIGAGGRPGVNADPAVLEVSARASGSSIQFLEGAILDALLHCLFADRD